MSSEAGTDALTASWQLQERVSATGFDWPDIGGVIAKAREEIAEIEAAFNSGDLEHAGREVGDLLLVTVNLARFVKADPSEALFAANERLRSRFEMLQAEVEKGGRRVQDCTLDELDQVWSRVKVLMGQGSENS